MEVHSKNVLDVKNTYVPIKRKVFKVKILFTWVTKRPKSALENLFKTTGAVRILVISINK